jgi:hypothetical protein
MDLLLWRNEKKTKTKQVSDGFSRWDFAGGFLGPFSFFPISFFLFHVSRYGVGRSTTIDSSDCMAWRCTLGAANLVVLLNTRNNVYKIELSADDKTRRPVFTRYLIVFAIFKLHSP